MAIKTWAWATALTFIFITAWFITYPIVTLVTDKSEELTETLNVDQPQSSTMYDALRYIYTIGFIVLICAVWGWAFASAQREDWRGHEYYG